MKLPRLSACAALTALLLAACGSTPPPPPDPPGCPTMAQMQEQARRYVAFEPLPLPATPLSMEAAACAQRKFVAALAPTHGRVVGYKAGLTNPAIQQRFGLSAPLRGTLLEKMMLSAGAELPARFGTRPFAEPDLVVEVGSSAIHDAKTPLEVLAALRAVRPFIELADTLVEDPSKITAPVLLGNNVGARAGVLGAPLPVQATPEFAAALKGMRVRSSDASGKELGNAPGAAILGDPLNAVIWLAAELKKDGITLKPGDLLSLGAFGGLPVQSGTGITVTYEGLPGNPAVSVRFK